MNYPEIFTRCVKVILKNEGGYGNHPADTGGETNYGIADAADGQKDGMVDINRDGNGDIKVKDLTVDQAREIYFIRYWRPMNLEALKDSNLVLQVFDMGVNAGTGTSIKILQRIIGAEVDGDCGPQTCGKANAFKGDLLNDFTDARKRHYMDIAKKYPEKQVFLGGWLHRVEKTKF